MPADVKCQEKPLYQRTQYGRGGITRAYWDYRDRKVFSHIARKHALVADLGCGEGITLEKASLLFPGQCLVGLDGLRENLSICRNHRLTVVGGDLHCLPFMDSTFDCALLIEVIEHLEHPERALLEVARILKPQGRLVILFPNDRVFKMARLLTGKWREAFYDSGHVKQWSPKGMNGLLSKLGFRMLKQESIPFLLWHCSLHHLTVGEKL